MPIYGKTSKVTQISKLKLVSQKQLSDLEPKLIWKLQSEWEWKFIQRSWVTWPTWPQCPYIVRTLAPVDRWPCYLVCSIVYASTTKIVQIMTLGWSWTILCQVRIWSHWCPYGKKWKLFIYLKTIATTGLKDAWIIQLNEIMKLSVYQRSRSFFDLDKRPLKFQS